VDIGTVSGGTIDAVVFGNVAFAVKRGASR